MFADRQKIADALSKLSAVEREELEAAVLSSLARSGTPIKSIVMTPTGPVEMGSRVLEVPMPAGYSGPRSIRLRRSGGAGLAGLDLEVRP